MQLLGEAVTSLKLKAEKLAQHEEEEKMAAAETSQTEEVVGAPSDSNQLFGAGDIGIEEVGLR